MEENREASKAFGETVRAKLAASRQGLRLEDLMGREEPANTEPEDEPQADE